MSKKYLPIDTKELVNINGGSGINWGQAAGACGEAAIIGAYFGNPVLGCANGVAFSLVSQSAKAMYKRYKKHH